MTDWPIEDNLEYQDGVLRDRRGRRTVLEILSIFPALQEAAEDIQGPVAGRIMYNAEKKNAERAVRVLVANNWTARILKQFARGRRLLADRAAAIISQQGYGTLVIDSYPSKTGAGRLVYHNSFEAEHRDTADDPVCHFMAGSIAGAVNVIYGQDMDVTETQCAATGADHCVFNVTPP